MLHDALDESGYTVLVAVNGEQALQRAAQAVPDVILLDAVMPGLDWLRGGAAPQADAPAGIPSADLHDRADRDRARGRGLPQRRRRPRTKPIRPMEVLARIAAHVQARAR